VGAELGDRVHDTVRTTEKDPLAVDLHPPRHDRAHLVDRRHLRPVARIEARVVGRTRRGYHRRRDARGQGHVLVREEESSTARLRGTDPLTLKPLWRKSARAHRYRTRSPPMQASPLLNLSPIDGRYHSRTSELRPYLSEFGLIRARVEVEIRWLLALLHETPLGTPPSVDDDAWLRTLYSSFDVADAEAVQAIERTTNHDVKAVEYWIRGRLDERPSLAGHRELVHFACTSEDINNLSWTLLLDRARTQVLVPAAQTLVKELRTLAHTLADQPMLSRTHGQTASPTTVGKEFANVVARLERQIDGLERVRLAGKANGAVGNYNAHMVAAPDVDWPEFSKRFITSLGLDFLPWTTQIEPHDQLAEYFDAVDRFNAIVIDLDRDVWGYISLGYFRQRTVAGEVGSSTMPHKVNPIDFENSEGNAGLASAMLGHMARKLPLSRWQRDLTDSTVLRATGAALGHALLAWTGCVKGLRKLDLAPSAVAADLDEAWEVLAEPIQMVMRRHGIPNAYERLKDASRGQRITREALHELIRSLEIPAPDRARLLELTPASYTGLAASLARKV
jgi:adenylosuccinate lyase